MLNFLKLPDEVDNNTTKEELLERFWAASYLFRLEFVKEEHFKESVITDLVKDIPYEPQSYWNSLWFAAMIYFAPKVGFHSLRGQMMQELDRIPSMSLEETDMLFSLYYRAFEIYHVFCPFRYSLKFVSELDTTVFYFDISKECKDKILTLAKKYSDILNPARMALCENRYFSRETMLLDIVDQIVSSKQYDEEDSYYQMLQCALNLFCGWEEPHTAEQLDFLKELEECVAEAARERKASAGNCEC